MSAFYFTCSYKEVANYDVWWTIEMTSTKEIMVIVTDMVLVDNSPLLEVTAQGLIIADQN